MVYIANDFIIGESDDTKTVGSQIGGAVGVGLELFFGEVVTPIYLYNQTLGKTNEIGDATFYRMLTTKTEA